METFSIPYDTSSVELHVSGENLAGVLTARTEEYRPELEEAALVRQALEHPIGTPRLSQLAQGKQNHHCHQRPHPCRPQQDHAAAPFGGDPPGKSPGGHHHFYCHRAAPPHNRRGATAYVRQ